MTEQLALFEPTGDQVIQLADKYQRDYLKAIEAAALWSDLGCTAVARRLLHAALDLDRKAAEMRMLAEFEALGGVA
jgi:hypothetical protein